MGGGGLQEESDDALIGVLSGEVIPPEETLTSPWDDSPSPPPSFMEDDGPAPRSGKRLHGATAPALERDAKTGIPSIGEWMGFFSNVLIRVATDFYIDAAFNGIDEDLLSEREIDSIRLDKDERDRIARPFAEYSYKSKFMRRHGRSIIAAGDSIDAVVQLGMWTRRVRKIARKYRAPGQQRQGEARVVRMPQPQQQRQQRQEPAAAEGKGTANERAREGEALGAEQNGHKAGWRPEVPGRVFNPNGG